MTNEETDVRILGSAIRGVMEKYDKDFFAAIRHLYELNENCRAIADRLNSLLPLYNFVTKGVTNG